jgi:hypothetical protein
MRRRGVQGAGGIIAAMSESKAEVGTPPPFEPDQTQPLKPVKRRRRWRSILLGVGGILVLLVLGGLGGYTSGISQRENAQSSIITQQLMNQFQYALVDEQFGRYEAARERLEFIISRRTRQGAGAADNPNPDPDEPAHADG